MDSNSPTTASAPAKTHNLHLSAAITIALILSYLLGIGPAARLDAAGVIPPQIYETLYFPLVSVAQSSLGQSVGIGRLLDWYVLEVWDPYRNRTTPPPPSGGS